jgi:hypothetical protein
MKKIIYILFVVVFAAMSCDDDDIQVFEKSADQRAAEAIATLKADLIAPANGWRVKYRPVDEAGAFYVLMKFGEDNKVRIQSDLGADDGDYINQTIGYRIDNSLGLELVLENYSFFHFLYEQDQATFGAEYEFDFVNKTPDNALVFVSKSDVGQPSTILFEEAGPNDQNLLGVDLNKNLTTLGEDLDLFSSSYRMVFDNKNLILYASLDEFKRVFSIHAASLKTNLQNIQNISYTSGYIVQGNSIVMDVPFSGTFLGTNLSFSSLSFSALSESSISVCTEPTPIHLYTGSTSTADTFTLETTLLNAGGSSFASLSTFYFSPLNFIINNEKQSVASQIEQDIEGALEMHLYYGLELNDGSLLYGLGFAILNDNGSVTFALRKFTPVLDGNNITFNFEPTITLFGSQTTQANIDNINKYLQPLTEGNKTYVFKFADDIYEFHNPCTGWSFVFVNGNQ